MNTAKPMHILWLAPQLLTFIADELLALQKLGIRTTCIVPALTEEQSKLASRYKLDIKFSQQPEKSPVLFARRLKKTTAALAHLPLPKNKHEIRNLYRIVKHSQFIRDFIQREKVDVIHSHFAWPEGNAGLYAARGMGIPIFLTLRGVDILVDETTDYGLIRDPYYRKLLTGTLRNVSHISVASRITRNAVKEFAPDLTNVSILPNGLDTSKFQTREVDRDTLFPERNVADHFVTVAVGNLIPLKRFDLAIDAFALLHEKHPKSLLVIIGEEKPIWPGTRKRLEEHTRQRGVKDSVVFTGNIPHDDVVSYMNAADTLAITSNSEGFGNIMLEAMACAKPVISTKVGAMPDVIEEGKTGFLVEKGDSESIANHFIHLAKNPDAAKEMGLAGHKKLTEAFTLEKRAEGFLEIYRRLSDENKQTKSSGLETSLQ